MWQSQSRNVPLSGRAGKNRLIFPFQFDRFSSVRDPSAYGGPRPPPGVGAYRVSLVFRDGGASPFGIPFGTPGHLSIPKYLY